MQVIKRLPRSKQWPLAYHLHRRCRSLEVDISTDLNKTIKLSKIPLNVGYRCGTYYAKHDGRVIGVVRVINSRFTPTPDQPVTPPRHKLEPLLALSREWDVYSSLSDIGLAPTPLWRGKDAAMFSYVDWPRVSSQLISHPDRFWPLMERIIPAVRRLHDQGIAHLDLNLGNILADEKSEQIAFIDFEFVPTDGLSLEQQFSFDYLNLVRVSTRRRRGGNYLRANPSRLVQILDQNVDERARTVDLDFAEDWLKPIDRIPELRSSLRSVFHNV